MNERLTLQLHLSHTVDSLSARVHQTQLMLEHLEEITVILAGRPRPSADAVTSWLRRGRYRSQASVTQSALLLESLATDTVPADAIATGWADNPGHEQLAALLALQPTGRFLTTLRRDAWRNARFVFRDTGGGRLEFPPRRLQGADLRVTTPDPPQQGFVFRTITTTDVPLLSASLHTQQIAGRWTIETPLEDLVRDIARSGLDPEHHCYLISGSGVILSCDQTAIRGRAADDLLGEEFSRERLPHLFAAGSGQYERVDPGGQHLLLMFRTVPAVDWVFVVTYPQQLTLTTVRDRIAEAFARISRGDLATQLDADVSDDMRQLVDGFNRMSEALNAHRVQREAAEAALRDAEEHWRSLVENIHDTIMTVDQHGTIQFVNRTVAGLSRSQVIGSSVYNYVPEEFRTNLRHSMQRVFETGKSISYELVGASPYGRNVWLSTRIGPLLRGDRVVAVTVVSTDITSRKQAEEALRESETKYRELADSITDVYFSIDQDLRFTFWNSASEKWTGVTERDAIGRSLYDLFPDLHGTPLEQAFLEALATREPQHVAVDVPDGPGRSALEYTMYPSPQGLSVIAKDITERISAERAVRESEQRYRSLYNNTPVMLQSSDRNGRLVSVSNHWLESMGYSLREVIGRKSSEFCTEESREQLENKILPAFLATGVLNNVPIRLRKKNGETIDILVSATAERDADGSIARSLEVLTDVTERNRADVELRYRIEFEQIITSISTSFVKMRLDEIDNGVTNALRTIGRFAGADRSFVILLRPDGTQADYAFEWYREGTPRFSGPRQGVPVTHFPWWMKAFRQGMIVNTPDVELLPAEAAAEQAILRAQGVNSVVMVPMVAGTTLIGTVGFSTIGKRHVWPEDSITLLRITGELLATALERRSAEERIRALNADLEQRVVDRTAQLAYANKELEAFSYSVSHDLRAPLRAIDGFARILTEDYSGFLDDEGKRVLGVISANANKMGKLIDDLLSFSRLTRKGMETSRIDMQEMVTGVVNELCESMGSRHAAVGVGPLSAVTGDPSMMRQVFLNLIANALKFSRHSSPPTVTIGCHPGPHEVTYFVQDNGVGFDMQYAEKLFGVFQRLHTEEEFEGTGVGLALVQRIIHRHNGTIWAEAIPGAGATFSFRLPLEHKGAEHPHAGPGTGS